MQSRAAIATLLLSALLAGCAGKSASYPEAYILQADELPAGLKLSEVPEGMPVSSNPAEVPASLMSAMGDEFQDFIPEQVWVEFVENSTSTSEYGADGGLLIAAGFWADAQKVESALQQMRAEDDGLCSQEEPGTLLQDGNVLVIVAGDESMRPWIPKIIDALQEDAPNLKDVC